MAENIFSVLKSDDNIAVSNFRRVRHSASNYFSSIDRSSFTGRNVVTQVINGVGQVGGVLGGVAGGIALGAGTVVVGAGFLAAVSGPQVAVTAAVIGIALLVMATYSNREAAHKELSPYMWTLVDDKPPAIEPTSSLEHLTKAAGAAATLMDDGKSQIKLLGNKLQAAEVRFRQVTVTITTAHNDYVAAQTELANIAPMMASAAKNVRLRAAESKLQRAKDTVTSTWDNETKAGGAIHQYVRRSVHTSNYLQASHIISLAMKEKLAPGSVVGKPVQDFFKDIDLAKNCRKSFSDLSDLYKAIVP